MILKLSIALIVGILGPLATLYADEKAAAVVLTVACDRVDALYKQGETVTFQIKLEPPKSLVAGEAVNWTLSKDGVAPTTAGEAMFIGDTATVTGELDEPGFLQCRVSFNGANQPSVTALASAAIDPLLIKPSMSVPDDFDSFWAAEKLKLAKVPMNPRLTPQVSPAKTIEVFDVQADSIGNPVSGYYARPIGAKPQSLPIILTVHGAGVNSSSLTGATGWAGQGFIAMDINAHGLPNGKPKQFYTDLANGALKDYRRRGRESRETIYFHDMFLRLVRAIDFLTAQPEWDGRTLVVHGSSQGGFQSIVAAGVDPRVTFFAAGVPAGCDHTGFQAGRINGWPKFIATGEMPADDVAQAVRYYDATNFATRTQAAGIVTVGFIDTTCPPSSVYATYNALGGKREIFNSILTGHTSTAPTTNAMRKAITDHVESMKR